MVGMRAVVGVFGVNCNHFSLLNSGIASHPECQDHVFTLLHTVGTSSVGRRYAITWAVFPCMFSKLLDRVVSVPLRSPTFPDSAAPSE